MDNRLSWSQALSLGLSTTVIGLAIVFIVLILLAFIVYLFKFLRPTQEPSGSIKLPVVPPEEPVVVSLATQGEDPDVVAAIMAAIAASMNTSADKLVVRSFRKAAQWRQAARNEHNRFNR